MSKLRQPILIVLGLVVCLIMLRLGVWQLDRAEKKNVILKQQQAQALLPAIELQDLIKQFESTQQHSKSLRQQRFRSVTARGQYDIDKSIYIDNRVLDGNVGYNVLTPFHLTASDWWVMVDRGWLAVGESRAKLPTFKTQTSSLELAGNLNVAAVAPPLWDSDFSVSDGAVWQYLPLPEYAHQMQLKLLPLVLELSPEQPNEIEAQLIRKPIRIDGSAVAMHKGYAFQWFTMAIAFLIACIVLLFKTRRSIK